MRTYRWRQEKPCSDCPFNTRGPGRHLRDSLLLVRWEEIMEGIEHGKVFQCHQTTEETGAGSNLICAGALAYQIKRGCVPDDLQLAERLLARREGRRAFV